MITPAYELSVLYEIASLPFETTEKEICELVMEKLIRVFLANKCAIIKLRDKIPVKICSYGFKKGVNVYETIKKKQNNGFKYNLSNGILFAERNIPFTPKQIKFLIILADRLDGILGMLESKKLKQDAQEIKTIYKTIPDPIIIIDSQNKVLETNENLLNLLHRSRKEVIGKKFQEAEELCHESVKTVKEKKFLDPITPCEIYAIIDKRKICYELKTAKIKFRGKNALVISFRDITKRKEIDKIKSEFISLTSHQLRTPASGIKWVSELLLKGKAGKLKKGQAELIDDIIQYNDRMIKMINELLNVEIIKNQTISINKTKFSILPLFKKIINDHKKIVNGKTSKIILLPKLKNIVLTTDKEKFHEILDNLLENSIRYCNKTPEIKISWKINKNEIEFQISDNGIGIPKEELCGIFKPFFRGKMAIKKDTTKAGLGLYIVKTIIDVLQGKIWLKSEIGKGTTFYFTIPIK